eukprot:253079-Pelagomonas_calceolata.AAC.1
MPWPVKRLGQGSDQGEVTCRSTLPTAPLHNHRAHPTWWPPACAPPPAAAPAQHSVRTTLPHAQPLRCPMQARQQTVQADLQARPSVRLESRLQLRPFLRLRLWRLLLLLMRPRAARCAAPALCVHFLCPPGQPPAWAWEGAEFKHRDGVRGVAQTHIHFKLSVPTSAASSLGVGGSRVQAQGGKMRVCSDYNADEHCSLCAYTGSLEPGCGREHKHEVMQ